MTRHQLQVVQIPLADLHPHPMNARRGNVGLIAESLRELDQYRPVVVNRGTRTGRPNEILAGHHLVLAATELGWTEVAATYVDVDDAEGTKIMLADNRTSDVATYDDALLAELLASLPDLAGSGYHQEDLDALEALLKGYDLDPDAGDDDQDVLDRSDQTMWPEVRVKLAPENHRRWLELPGADDLERMLAALTRAGV